MAQDQDDSEETGVDRITGRLDRRQLSRVTMPGGGEVYRGEIATRALDSLGARAMTLDSTIVVGDDFDPSNVEDQALFAHEMYHVEHGDGHGGGGGDNFADAEETAARAAEAMVLHRSAAGGAEAGYTQGGGGGHGHPHSGNHGGRVGAGSENANQIPDGEDDPDSSRGYGSLVGQGMSHDDVVDHLARKVLTTFDERDEVKRIRRGDNKGFA
jgi:hypothetical protein